MTTKDAARPIYAEEQPPRSGPDDFRYRFWDFGDLVDRKIVRSRYQLKHLIDQHAFPRPIKPAGVAMQATAVWQVAEVMAWLDERAAARTAAE